MLVHDKLHLHDCRVWSSRQTTSLCWQDAALSLTSSSFALRLPGTLWAFLHPTTLHLTMMSRCAISHPCPHHEMYHLFFVLRKISSPWK